MPLTDADFVEFASRSTAKEGRCVICTKSSVLVVEWSNYNGTSEKPYICKSCFINMFEKCNVCGYYFHSSYIYSLDNDGEQLYLCSRCWEMNTAICSCCGNHIYLPDEDCCERVDTQDNELIYCRRCFDSGEHLVFPYSYTPQELMFYESHKDRKETLFFGIELEVEEPDNANRADIISKFPDFVFCKHDGSIQHGFEIVSHPATFNWLLDNQAYWNSILDIRMVGYRSYKTETCGMHVHMSKAAFGNYHLYKFMQFFYDKHNIDFILNVSQRKSVLLSRWASCQDSKRNLIYKARYKSYGEEGKYQAIRLERRDTVEVRVFRGTLNPQSFWKNIEFCKALYDFTKYSKVHDINEIGFRGFLKTKRKMFPNLYNYLWGTKAALENVC